MRLIPKNSVGKKITMAVTGHVMVLFIIAHLLGNSTIHAGGLNAYAANLHSLPALVWFTRIFMITAFLYHLHSGIIIYLENRRAKPEVYTYKKYLSTTFSGRTMIWSGGIVGVFVIYHLLHFTFQVINSEFSAKMNIDTAGRPDVSMMVLSGLSDSLSSLIYILSLTALLLHLYHGIQSSVQTVGLNNEKSLPVVKKAGTIAAIIIFIGYISIPLMVLSGIMKG